MTEQFLSGGTDETGASSSHGTAVASIAAAGRITSSSAAWGVAWGADIAMFAIPTGSSGGVYNPISLAELNGADAEWAAEFNTILAWRDGTRKVDILNLSVGYRGIIDNYTTQELRQNFDAAIAAMAQAGASEKMIMVWSAGNAHGKTCSSPTPNCVNDKINAVSVQVLPGLVARISELRGHTIAVAALRESDKQIASFSNRCGIAASYCIAAPGQNMAFAYFGPHPDLYAARLDNQAEIRGSHLALAEGAVKATLAEQDGLSAAAFTTKGVPGRQPTLGAALSWRGTGSPLGLRAGWIGEPETLLGSIGEGAFGTLAGDTAFLGLDAGTDLGGWRIGATAELGIVAPETRGGLITRVSPLATSAFALHAARGLGSTGALRLSVAQPLRVESGRASLTVPGGRTKAGVVMYGAVPADLAPSGRQLDIAGEWRRPLAKGELRLGTVLSLRPGHRKAADPEMTFLGGWRWEF